MLRDITIGQYYDVESVEAQGAITYRRGNFTKGQLEELKKEVKQWI